MKKKAAFPVCLSNRKQDVFRSTLRSKTSSWQWAAQWPPLRWTRSCTFHAYVASVCRLILGKQDAVKVEGLEQNNFGLIRESSS